MTNVIQKPKNLDRSELESRVKDMYKNVALFPDRKYHFEMGNNLAKRLGYAADQLKRIPASAIASFAGVGFHFDFADIQEGETIVDLGSGSGMDVFYAALQVGTSGKVIGIDMTDEQLEKSIKISNLSAFQKIYFLKAYIENLPIVSGTADKVISNGVINLSAEKDMVLKEAARILRPGGRLAISDIVSQESLPHNITSDCTLWAACVGGAIPFDHYCSIIERAGLKLVETKDNPYAFLSDNAKSASKRYGIKSVSFLAEKKI